MPRKDGRAGAAEPPGGMTGRRGGARSSPSRSSSLRTADRFLDTAERLFAELGYQGASIRAIANEAGVNLGALHYYWGSKTALYKAVIARRLGPMNQERLRRFEECERAAQGQGPNLREILAAFVGPAMHMGDADPEVADITRRLYHRMVSDPSPDAQELAEEVYREVSERFIGLLRPACAHLADDEFYWRIQAAYGVVRFSQAGMPWMVLLSGGAFQGQDVDEGVRHIVEALYAGLMAPSILR